MEQRVRRWLVWSGLTIAMVLVVASGVFTLYWHVLWPFTPEAVIDSSPWIEPQLRALVKLGPRPSGYRLQEMESMLQTKGANDRQWRVIKAMQSQSEQSNQALLVLLTSPNHQVQLSTFWFLATAKRALVLSGEVQQVVIAGLSNEDREFRFFAFMTLVYQDDDVAKPAVIKILQSDSDLREYALKYFAPRRDYEYTQWIIPLLRDPEMRGLAINALTQIGDPRAIPAVKFYASDPFVREGVQEFLQRVQQSQEMEVGEEVMAPTP